MTWIRSFIRERRTVRAAPDLSSADPQAQMRATAHPDAKCSPGWSRDPVTRSVPAFPPVQVTGLAAKEPQAPALLSSLGLHSCHLEGLKLQDQIHTTGDSNSSLQIQCDWAAPGRAGAMGNTPREASHPAPSSSLSS